MSVQPRLIQTDGYAVLSGVEMVLKAGLESGIDTLVGAQLDGPHTYAELLHEHGPLLNDKGLRTLTFPDARQAIAAMQSAWFTGSATLGLFDELGVVDAAAVLLTTDRPKGAEPGGVLLCFGDSDRPDGLAAMALLRRAGWVVIEPTLQDEVKSFASAGLGISRASGRPVALALSSDLIAGAATVACSTNVYPNSTGESKPVERASENVDPLLAALTEARSSKINTVVNPPGKDEDLPIALVAIGRAYGWTRQAMAELGLAGRVPILRLGMLTPLDKGLIRRHAAECRTLLVLDATGVAVAEAICQVVQPVKKFRAKEISEAPQETDKPVEPKKKTQAIPLALDSDAGPIGVIDVLRPWIQSHPTLPKELVSVGLARFARVQAQGDEPDIDLPTRSDNPPPGSSLIDLSVVLGRLRRDLSDAQYMLEKHRTGPIDLAVFGELDAAAKLLLSRWAPLQGGLDCDGRLAGAAAAGAASNSDHRSVALMTSRRFFSLGSSAIADAVRADRNTVFVIHTEDPAEALGPRRRFKRRRKANALDMQAIVEGINLGRRKPTPSVNTIDPADRPRMARLLERLILSEGVHVVIARRRKGPRYYRKASEVHRKQSARRGYVAKQGCLVHCPEAGPITPRRRIELGILGVEPIEPGPDPWTTSISWSWHDDSVMHALADPALGLAILERSQPERSRVVAQDLDDLPDPPKPLHANADAWRATLVGITGSAFDLTLQLLLEAGAAMGYLVRASACNDEPDEPAARRADILYTRREPENAPHVPAAPGRSSAPMLTATPTPGHADLLLATELTEAARLITHQQRAAQIPAIVDTLLIPDIDALSTGNLPDTAALLRAIDPDLADPDENNQDRHNPTTTILPVARLAEWFWGHQRYAAWVYLGYLVQRGLVPLTSLAIDAAGQRVLGMTDPRSAEAVKVGRKLAIDPTYADRVLTQDPPDLDTLLRTLADDLAEQAGSRRGASLGGSFQAIVQPLIDNTQQLDDDIRRVIVTTAQRCVYWAGPKNGPAYCKRFVNTLGHLLSIDTPDKGHALTRAAVDGLARAMLIPDEVYLAALLTSPERYRRDRRRFNISLERDDKITYVHKLRPEFDLFKRRVGFTITLGQRALKALASLHIMRRIRPGWYRTQREFRDDYLKALGNLPELTTDTAYRQAIDLAACTTPIRGRGDVRRDSVNDARRALEKRMSSSEGA